MAHWAIYTTALQRNVVRENALTHLIIGAEYRIRTDVNYSPLVWKTSALPLSYNRKSQPHHPVELTNGLAPC